MMHSNHQQQVQATSVCSRISALTTLVAFTAALVTWLVSGDSAWGVLALAIALFTGFVAALQYFFPRSQCHVSSREVN